MTISKRRRIWQPSHTLGAAGNRTSVTEMSGRTITDDELYRLKSGTIGLDPVTANNGRSTTRMTQLAIA
jgi:hypothetical protein